MKVRMRLAMQEISGRRSAMATGGRARQMQGEAGAAEGLTRWRSGTDETRGGLL